MEGTDEQEENSLDDDVSDSHGKLLKSASNDESKSDKFKVEEDATDAVTLCPALEKSKSDLNVDTAHLSRYVYYLYLHTMHKSSWAWLVALRESLLYRNSTEIGSERLKMRNCPFFYIPDNALQKLVSYYI